jgi:chromate transporter
MDRRGSVSAGAEFLHAAAGAGSHAARHYSGWRTAKGGLAAGLLFVLPGALVVLALSMLYAAFGNLPESKQFSSA